MFADAGHKRCLSVDQRNFEPFKHNGEPEMSKLKFVNLLKLPTLGSRFQNLLLGGFCNAKLSRLAPFA